MGSARFCVHNALTSTNAKSLQARSSESDSKPLGQVRPTVRSKNANDLTGTTAAGIVDSETPTEDRGGPNQPILPFGPATQKSQATPHGAPGFLLAPVRL